MNLNKCGRCGCFFMSGSNVCPNCQPKDMQELSKLTDFLQENNAPDSLDVIAFHTGISLRNLNRFLAKEQFSALSNQLGMNDKGNISITL